MQAGTTADLGLSRRLRFALTLEITANENFTATGPAGGIETGFTEQSNALPKQLDTATVMSITTGTGLSAKMNIAMVALHVDFTAAVTVCNEACPSSNFDILLRHQADAAVGVAHDAGSVDRTAVLQVASEQPRRALPGDDVAEVDYAVIGRLHVELDGRVIEAGDADRLACSQDDVAVIDLDNAAILDIGRHQHDVAIGTGVDITVVLNAAETTALELEITLEKILVGDVQRRAVETGSVDTRAGADHHAVLVDQKDLAIGIEIAVNLRRVVTDDAVHHRAATAGLDKVRGLARTDTEALPVDDRVAAVGDVQRICIRLRESRATVDYRGSGRICQRTAAPDSQGYRGKIFQTLMQHINHWLTI